MKGKKVLPNKEHSIRKTNLSEDMLNELHSTRSVEMSDDIEIFDEKPRPIRSINGKYQPYMIDEVFHLAQYGMTNEDICAFYNIHHTTLQKYIRLYPELDKKLHEGRELNGMKLVDNLYRQAIGYMIEETDKEYYYKTDPDTGERVKLLKSEKISTKHVQGNAKVAMWLLKCRFPLMWAGNPDSQKQKAPISITNNFDLSSYTLDELELMKKLGLSQNSSPFIQD